MTTSSTPEPGVATSSGQSVPVSDLVAPPVEGNLQVVRHTSDRFYELLDGNMRVALLVYEQTLQQTAVTHVTVRKDRRGHGLATTLIASALPDLAAGAGGIVANYCNSVARFLDSHPEFMQFVTPER